MKKILKTLVLGLLTAALMCCALPAAFAADSEKDEEKLLVVNLDAMGGSSSVTALVANSSGKLSALPEQPTLDGYTFDGWYTEPVGGTKVTTATVFTADETTIYAHWTVKNSSTATTPKPTPSTQPTETPEIVNHLGGFVIAGVLLGSLALASAL